VGGDGSGPSPPDDPLDVDAEPATAGTEPGAAETGGPASGESFDLGSAMGESGGGADEDGSGPAPRDERGEAAPAGGAETAVTGQGGASAGGQGDAPTGVEASPDTDPAADEPIERTTVRVTADVGGIYGVDGRSYDLSAEDVVTLPTPNAENLVSKRAAERLD
jgi:DNA replication factor GINS